MRILMVYCNSPQENALPMGLSQLITCLKQAGHEVRLFHTTFYRQRERSAMEFRMEALQFKPCAVEYEPADMAQEFRAFLASFEPALVGFSVVEPTFPLMLRLLEASRDVLHAGSIRVAVGGVHAICWPESVATLPQVDFICVGEGEETFVELCAKLESGTDVLAQDGFWVRDGSGWHRNPVRRLTDLDRVPMLDISDWGDRYLNKPMMGRLLRTISVELSRGCPYRCTYCGNAWLNDHFASLGKWCRFKSIEKIGAEYDALIQRYRPEYIYKMSESLLAVGRKRFQDYAAMYRRYRVPFWIETRPETVTDENARMLAEMGCTRVSLGLESGNEAYRRERLRRPYTNAQVVKAADLLRKHGISFSMNLIVGFPGETRQMVFDGIHVLRRARPDSVSVFLFTPYKGCVLRRYCEEQGMIDEDFMGEDYFLMKYPLRNNTFGPEVVGLWRAVPLYVRLPEERFPLIEKSEALTPQGDAAYAELKKEYCDLMGWT